MPVGFGGIAGINAGSCRFGAALPQVIRKIGSVEIDLAFDNANADWLCLNITVQPLKR